MTDLKAYMIGPKAENLDLFRQLILEALDDHAFWRRNFFPEDNPAIRSVERSGNSFRDFEDRLRDVLFDFLADAKQGVPFFSPRYIGHMNTDLLLPALLGYFGSMLYNQNNVAGESSPMTERLEREVLGMLARMVGYLDKEAGDENAYGYLTSGGTAANIYGLWVARNLRCWPLSLRLLLGDPDLSRDEQHVAEAVADLQIPLPGRQWLPLREAGAWELMNVPLRWLFGLREECRALMLSTDGPMFEQQSREEERKAVADQALGNAVHKRSIQKLGDRGFYRRLSSLFPTEQHLLGLPWRVMIAENKHYSFPKAMDLLGLGQSALEFIPLDRHFTLDTGALDASMSRALEEKQPVLAVVSIFGATEEGSLDDLPSIVRVVRGFESSGLTGWLHVDACYGGYLGSVVRDSDAATPASGVDLRRYFLSVALDLGASRESAEHYVDPGPAENGWLDWSELSARVAALCEADSLSLDPHKLGYIPYPAGAILLRSGTVREAVSYEVPYLGADDAPGSFAGRFTLEGSRPGATAAGCWLAHRTIPLNQKGHGRIIAASMLGARQLVDALETRAQLDEEVGIWLVNRPHMNMVCYVPFHKNTRDIDELGRVTKRVKNALSPIRSGPADSRQFMIVATKVDVDLRDSPLADVPHLRSSFSAQEGTVKIDVLRSVVMGPTAFGSTTRPSRGEERLIFEQFADHLVTLTKRAFYEERADRFIKGFRPDEKVLVVDDQPNVRSLVEGTFLSIAGNSPGHFADFRDNLKEALEVVRLYTRPLRLAFLDIDLHDRGGPDGGWQILEAICERNDVVEDAFRVEHVVFLSVGAADHQERIESYRAKCSAPPGVTFIAKSDIEAEARSGDLQKLKRLLLRGG